MLNGECGMLNEKQLQERFTLGIQHSTFSLQH